MKYRFVVFLTLILSLFSLPNSVNPDPGRGAWGYILHTSRHTDSYLEKATSIYSVIAITGFKLASDGSLISTQTGLTIKTIELTRKHSLVLYPLITFSSPDAGRKLLNSKNARARAIRSIAGLVSNGRYAGAHFDFEYLPPEDSVKLGDFLSELKALPFKGKITLAVFPPVDFPKKWSGFHDLSIIGKYADEIVMMCYDLHNQHTGPGPVTDTAWAEKNIREALKYISAERLWLGIPAYGYRWCAGKTEVVSAKEAAMRGRACRPERHISRNLHYSCQTEGRTCQVFASDRITREALIGLAKKYSLAGTALWRLGLED